MKTIEDVLKKYKYPGRGIVFGVSGDKVFIAYFIMGRSINSKNRILELDEEENVKTKFYDNINIKNEDLIIYKAVIHEKNKIIVSNGNQTDTIHDYIKKGKSFEEAMRSRNFENDPPIYTPRIAGIIEFENNKVNYKLAIIKADVYKNEISTERHFFEYPLPKKSVGHIIHTYIKKEKNETATFCTQPKKVYIPKTLKEFSSLIWNSLYEEYKVSLFTESVDIKTKSKDKKIININI